MVLDVKRAGPRHEELDAVGVIQAFDDAWQVLDQLYLVEGNDGGLGKVNAQLHQPPLDVSVGWLVEKMAVLDALQVEVALVGVRHFAQQVLDGRGLAYPPHARDDSCLLFGQMGFERQKCGATVHEFGIFVQN